VDDQSWDLYHDSLWYKEQEGTPGKYCSNQHVARGRRGGGWMGLIEPARTRKRCKENNHKLSPPDAIFKLETHKNKCVCGPGFAPDSTGGAYNASSDP